MCEKLSAEILPAGYTTVKMELSENNRETINEAAAASTKVAITIRLGSWTIHWVCLCPEEFDDFSHLHYRMHVDGPEVSPRKKICH